MKFQLLHLRLSRGPRNNDCRLSPLPSLDMKEMYLLTSSLLTAQ